MHQTEEAAVPAVATNGAAISGNVLPLVVLFVLARRKLSSL